MAPEIMTSDFVTAVLTRIEELEEKGIDQYELLHSIMFIIAVMCQNYGLDEDLALELQDQMFRRCNIAMGGQVIVDGGAEA